MLYVPAAYHLLQIWVLAVPRRHRCAQLVAVRLFVESWGASSVDGTVAIPKSEDLFQGRARGFLLDGEVALQDEGGLFTVQTSRFLYDFVHDQQGDLGMGRCTIKYMKPCHLVVQLPIGNMRPVSYGQYDALYFPYFNAC